MEPRSAPVRKARAQPPAKEEPQAAPRRQPLKVYIYPEFGGEDAGDGGVRRVVEAQRLHLPAHGVQVVETPEAADVLAAHISAPIEFFTRYVDKPLVAHCHGFYWAEYDWNADWYYKANEDVMALVRGADIVTAPSEWVAQAIRRNTCRDVRVINHGVEPQKAKAPPSVRAGDLKAGSYVLWNKTRPDPVCDPLPMLQAALRMPDVTFVSTFGEENIPNLVLTGRLPFDQAIEYVNAAGVYLATARETFGIGTLEALAAGVPVVGFRYGGQQEICRHLVDSYLAEPGDIDDLCRGIAWALRYHDEIAPHARARAAEFTWELAAEEYAAIYREAAETKTRRIAGPAVSVIVTAYNLARFLPETLESIRRQTFKDWECVIVDDASPDNCGAIAEEWAARDRRFRVIHNQQNVYLAEARNVGIRAARGRYIMPLDADDMLTPEALTVLVAALDRDRELDITYGNVLFVEEDGATRRDFGTIHGAGHSGWPMVFDFAQQMRGPGQLLPYASLFRRRAWELTGGYRRRVRSSEDCDLWLRLASYGFAAKMVTTADTLVYRIRPDSMSATTGWADEENRRWFPWIMIPELVPGGAVIEGAPADRRLPIHHADPPIISIIIPVGPGHERYVKDAVDSVDAQTFRGWECIVINDTGRALPELPAWVKQLETDGRRGAAYARNVGIAASKAKLFLPLDADDYLQPWALRLLLDAHVESGGDIIYPDFWEDPVIENDFKVFELPDYDARAILNKALHSCVALTPKKVWEETGGYDIDLPWEDWAFQIKTLVAGHCSRRLAAPAFTYRKHTGTRRDLHYANLRESGAVMMTRFRDIWEGDLPMACSSCGSRPTYYPSQPGQMSAMAKAGAPATNAVLVRYTGNKAGNIYFTGQGSGTLYAFAADEPPKWVHESDAPFFMSRADFQRVETTAEPGRAGAAPVETTPVLVAGGPPPRSFGPDAALAPLPGSELARDGEYREPAESNAPNPGAGAMSPAWSDLPPAPPSFIRT